MLGACGGKGGMRAMMRWGAGAAALVLVGRGGLLVWGEGLLYVWWTRMSSMLGWFHISFVDVNAA